MLTNQPAIIKWGRMSSLTRERDYLESDLETTQVGASGDAGLCGYDSDNAFVHGNSFLAEIGRISPVGSRSVLHSLAIHKGNEKQIRLTKSVCRISKLIPLGAEELRDSTGLIAISL